MRAAELDYRPLSRRPRRHELAAVRVAALNGDFGGPTADRVRSAKARSWTGLLVFGGFVTGIPALITLVQAIRGSDTRDTVVGLAVTAGVAALCLTLYVVARFLAAPLTWRRDVRLILFGRANDFEVQLVAEDRTLPGTLGERLGRHRAFVDRVTFERDGMPVEAGIYVEESYGANTARFECPYLAIRLPRSLPRMTFIARPVAAVAPSVEFGVDVLPEDHPPQHGRHVRLVSAPADGAFARRVFTDELIGVLGDHDHPANAEVRGEWFLAYQHTGTAHRDEQMWRRSLTTVELVTRSVGAIVAQDPDAAGAANVTAGS